MGVKAFLTGTKKRHFDQRYFRLTSKGILAYYSDEEAETPKGTVDFRYVTNVQAEKNAGTKYEHPEDHYVIEVVTKPRLWVFLVDTEHELKTWCGVFQRVCNIPPFTVHVTESRGKRRWKKRRPKHIKDAIRATRTIALRKFRGGVYAVMAINRFRKFAVTNSLANASIPPPPPTSQESFKLAVRAVKPAPPPVPGEAPAFTDASRSPRSPKTKLLVDLEKEKELLKRKLKEVRIDAKKKKQERRRSVTASPVLKKQKSAKTKSLQERLAAARARGKNKHAAADRAGKVERIEVTFGVGSLGIELEYINGSHEVKKLDFDKLGWQNGVRVCDRLHEINGSGIVTDLSQDVVDYIEEAKRPIRMVFLRPVEDEISQFKIDFPPGRVGMVLHYSKGYHWVKYTSFGDLAEQKGVKQGDKILKISGSKVVAQDSSDVVEFIESSDRPLNILFGRQAT